MTPLESVELVNAVLDLVQAGVKANAIQQQVSAMAQSGLSQSEIATKLRSMRDQAAAQAQKDVGGVG